jgi:hypothetical protein
MAGGGGLDIEGYAVIFGQMSSWGFVVAATMSCNSGCRDKVNSPYTDCAGLPAVEPAGWPSYYGEQLKTIDYAKQHPAAEGFSLVDWAAGVGIAGHSMGGQATSLSSHPACTAKWGIKAAVLHHSANGDVKGLGNIGVNVSVPLGAFTSSGDGIWKETRDIYENSPVKPKVYRDQTGFSHLEPVLAPPVENPMLATFTAAWFKVYLGGDPHGRFHSMIYNASNPSSLCNYADMTECETKEA